MIIPSSESKKKKTEENRKSNFSKIMLKVSV